MPNLPSGTVTWRAAVRPEDGILAAWLAFVAPGIRVVGGPDLATGRLAGVLIILSVVAAIVCLATRPSDQPRVSAWDIDGPRWILAGPLIAALALVSSIGIDQLGLSDGGIIGGPLALAAIVALFLNPFLPAIDSRLRRLLVLPFTMVAGSVFTGFTGDIFDGLDPAQFLGSTGEPGAAFAGFVVVLLLGGLGAFYAMLVVAPRELADPEDAGPRWLLRFVLFLIASLVGIGWLSLLA